MKRHPPLDQHPVPPGGDREAQLRQQQRDFTDEGSPPPGRVGKQAPRRDEARDDEPAGDRPPRRR